jgi:hypothetical protein
MTVWKHLLNMLFLLLCPHCWCNHQSCILFYYALASVACCVFYQGILWKEYCSAVLPSDIMMIWPWNTIQLWICEAVDLLLVVYLHSCQFSTCLWLATWRGVKFGTWSLLASCLVICFANIEYHLQGAKRLSNFCYTLNLQFMEKVWLF